MADGRYVKTALSFLRRHFYANIQAVATKFGWMTPSEV